jgi:3-isopropylmalate/(R)-2-methylmalate dehydratase large subunit
MGVMAKGGRAASTTIRNSLGRMGNAYSEGYLVNPAVAAASAAKGRTAHPKEVAERQGGNG